MRTNGPQVSIQGYTSLSRARATLLEALAECAGDANGADAPRPWSVDDAVANGLRRRTIEYTYCLENAGLDFEEAMTAVKALALDALGGHPQYDLMRSAMVGWAASAFVRWTPRIVH